MRLYLANRDTGITIIPWLLDSRLWCVRWADGLLSPPGNLTRAKDAALLFARQVPGFTGRRVHRWECTAAHSEGGTARGTTLAVPDSHPAMESRPDAS